MRRALTLAVIGSFLVVALGAEVSFSSIKAINTPASKKDSWSFKGAITGVPAGLDYAEVLTGGGHYLDEVIFADDECKTIRMGAGFMCKTDGARISATKAKAKDGSTYYKVAATAKRREFDLNTLETPLEVELKVFGLISEKSANGDCVEKEGMKGQLRATCKPSAAIS